MVQEEFFKRRPQISPVIYAFELVDVPTHKGYLKIGYTDRDADTRVKEIMHTSAVSYRIVLEESAMRPDGSCISDHDVHKYLKAHGAAAFNEGKDKNEWYKCSIGEVKRRLTP